MTSKPTHPKVIVRNKQHINSKSYEFVVLEINSKKVSMTYESYNACEKFSVQIFDGFKWNHFLSMLDLGILPNSTSYIWNTQKREERAKQLLDKADNLCQMLLK